MLIGIHVICYFVFFLVWRQTEKKVTITQLMKIPLNFSEVCYDPLSTYYQVLRATEQIVVSIKPQHLKYSFGYFIRFNYVTSQQSVLYCGVATQSSHAL